MFTRSEVIVLRNKQTDAAENIQRSSLRYYVGGKIRSFLVKCKILIGLYSQIVLLRQV